MELGFELFFPVVSVVVIHVHVGEPFEVLVQTHKQIHLNLSIFDYQSFGVEYSELYF